MTTPDDAPAEGTMMRTVLLAPGHRISRVIRGGWQLAGGHGPIDPVQQVDDMGAFADAGITTFDCADIYTGVEDIIGAFRQHYARVRGAQAAARIKVHTKLVPDLSRLDAIDRGEVRQMVLASLTRLQAERLDLVQFHWWDMAAPRWLEVMHWLAELRDEGLVANIGATNFDTDSMAAMLDAGIPLVSMQVQYSLLDNRPAARMAPLAQARGVGLLCYGTVAGGFLGDRWRGVPAPAEPLENRSLVKYRLIIDEFGGWDRFQALLDVLAEVGARHDADTATVASAAVLARAGVAAVIVGARSREHLDANLAIDRVRLTAEDLARIAAITDGAPGPAGDVYALERDREGAHGRIMKYELNTG